MSESTVAILAAVIGSGALSSIITNVFNRIEARKKSTDGLRDGVRVLLYDRIKHLGRKYIALECITAEDLEDLIDMHRIYHDPKCLDGNGFLDSVMCSVKSLRIVDRYPSTYSKKKLSDQET